jgi:hypothetical protein
MYFFTLVEFKRPLANQLDWRWWWRQVRCVGQWQAQEAPQPPAEVSPDELLDVSEAEAAAAGAAVALAPPDPPRKSVAYQPDPLSWKPAAVTCL